MGANRARSPGSRRCWTTCPPTPTSCRRRCRPRTPRTDRPPRRERASRPRPPAPTTCVTWPEPSSTTASCWSSPQDYALPERARPRPNGLVCPLRPHSPPVDPPTSADASNATRVPHARTPALTTPPPSLGLFAGLFALAFSPRLAFSGLFARPAPAHRTFLPGFLQPLARQWRHRPGPVDRQARIESAPGTAAHRERTGRRLHLLLPFRRGPPAHSRRRRRNLRA